MDWMQNLKEGNQGWTPVMRVWCQGAQGKQFHKANYIMLMRAEKGPKDWTKQRSLGTWVVPFTACCPSAALFPGDTGAFCSPDSWCITHSSLETFFECTPPFLSRPLSCWQLLSSRFQFSEALPLTTAYCPVWFLCGPYHLYIAIS